MSQSLDQELSLNALRMALVDHVPQIHHSDQGVHYAAHAYIDLLSEYQFEISMAAIGKPEENGYAERFMRTIKRRGGGLIGLLRLCRCGEPDWPLYRGCVHDQAHLFILGVSDTGRI